MKHPLPNWFISFRLLSARPGYCVIDDPACPQFIVERMEIAG